MILRGRFPELGPFLLTLPIGTPRRTALLRRLGATVGTNTRIHPIRVINADWRNLTIGDDCYVGADVSLDLADRIVLGDRVTIAARAVVLTHQDPGDARVAVTVRLEPVIFEPDTFVGAGAIILAGARPSGIIPAGALVKRQPQPEIPKSNAVSLV